MSVGENIKKHRKENKLTQTQLAELVNKKYRTIQKYESGEINPPTSVLIDIAKVLDVPIIDLIGVDKAIGMEKLSDYENEVLSATFKGGKIGKDDFLYSPSEQKYKSILDALWNWLKTENCFTQEEEEEIYRFILDMLKMKIDSIESKHNK